MKAFIAFAILFQMILSGCSPDLGFQAGQSKSVTLTDPEISPKKPVIIQPAPTRDVPKPAKNHLGFLRVSNAVLTRQEDKSILLKAQLSIKDKTNKTLWSREVELDGKLNPDFKANLYPLKGDQPGELKVRARLTCIDYESCEESIVDIFVQDSEKKPCCAGLCHNGTCS